jgi:hypothetical protein
LPEAGPKCRHQPSQYAVRARIWISVRSGIRARTASPSFNADADVPTPTSRLSVGTPSESRVRKVADQRRDERVFRTWRARGEVLLGVLDGIELHPDEEQLVEWLAGWDDWTVTTTAMLVGAARAAGPLEDLGE